MPAPTAFADVVINTLNRVRRRQWDDISMSFPEYEYVSRFIKGKRVKIRSSPTLQFNVQIANNNSFEQAYAYDVSTPHVEDMMTKGTEVWSQNRCHTAWADDELVFQGGSTEEIVDTYDVRLHALRNDHVDGMELQLVAEPASNTVNSMRGILHWIQRNATKGFNGGNPSGHTAGAGNISTSTVPNWANWTDTYSVFSQTDLFDALAEATYQCRFRAPNPYPAATPEAPQWTIMTTFDAQLAMEIYATNANDNLGRDVGRYRGDITFKGIPIKPWWVLSHSTSTAVDATNPFIGIDWATFDLYMQSGFDMKLDYVNHAAGGQLGVESLWMRTITQLVCMNRRRNFLIYQV